MAKHEPPATVEEFIKRNPKWKNEFLSLRKIIQDFDMVEAIKWGKPCYIIGNDPIILLQSFHEYCAVVFFQGALINDYHFILAVENDKVQSARQLRFTNQKEVMSNKRIIKDYINQAIQMHRAGMKVLFEDNSDCKMPAEFELALATMPQLYNAFVQLNPIQQQNYVRYFSSLKLKKSRENQIEKFKEHILQGKGLYDK